MLVISPDPARWRLRLDIKAPALARRAVDCYSAFIALDDVPPTFTARLEVAGRGVGGRATTMCVRLDPENDTGAGYRLDAPGFLRPH